MASALASRRRPQPQPTANVRGRTGHHGLAPATIHRVGRLGQSWPRSRPPEGGRSVQACVLGHHQPVVVGRHAAQPGR
jgi:hypothetical protein